MTVQNVSTVSREVDLPLAGRRIVLTRPHAQSGDFETAVEALGGIPIVAPAIALVAPDVWTVVDAALRRIGTYDWIVFTSANAVRALVNRAGAIGIGREQLREARLAAVGPTTARVLEELLCPPDVIPSTHTSESLGRELADVAGARVLLPRGDLADDALPDALRAHGAFPDTIVVYHTVPGGGLAAIVEGICGASIDALLFTSASAAHFVATALAEAGVSAGELTGRLPVTACLGSMTAAAAQSAGFPNVIVSEGASQAELIDRVVQWFARHTNEQEGMS
jgi:uroporphyrinogen-III synthase